METSALTTSLNSKSIFHVFTRMTTGYSKILRGKPCEDSVTVIKLKNAVICAVADGHGSSKCKYANIGSRLATEVACKVLHSVYDKYSQLHELYDYFADNRETVEKDVISEWNKRVLLDYFEKPESEKLSKKKDELFEYIDNMFKPLGKIMSMDETRVYYAKRDNLAKIQSEIAALYGTTLNFMLITEKFIICFGIGDGDIVAVQGKRIDWLLPPSERLSVLTESLCDSPNRVLDAFNSIIIRKTKGKRGVSSTGINPDFVMIATDGFRNSFLSDEHFAEKLISVNNEKNKGYKTFQRRSQKWIEQLTKESLYRDDITFGFIFQ